MVMDMKENLRRDYRIACDAYLKAFCKKHDFVFENDMWVGNEPGTIAACGDFFFDMQTIMYDVDLNAPEEELLKWYDYCQKAYEFKLIQPNFRSWVCGCPRVNDDVFKNMEELRDGLRGLCDKENERFRNAGV